MTTDLKLPLLGDVMQEGTLAAWLIDDGARVERGQPIYQVETDKVNYAVEAPAGGILRQLVPAGDTVPVGALVGKLLEAAHHEPATDGLPSAALAGTEAGQSVIAPVMVRARLEVRASPAARRLARQRGIDLSTLAAGSRMLRTADLPPLAAHLSRSAPASNATELSHRRRVIGDRMLASLHGMAQLTIALETDFSDAERLRQQLKQLWPADAQPTITDLVVRACVLALQEHPAFNATLDNSQLTVHHDINVGLAVDAEEGLIVPVLHASQTLSLQELARRSKLLASRAHASTLDLADLQGGTFTVTTLGQLGIDFFTPIVNPPQVAILGVGRLFPRLALLDGRLEQRSSMYLNLSFDHRAVDGAPAARFLNTVKRYLELPAALVAM